ncbi:hypothetical protein EMIHUDRAFT_111324 [Emiliania huxleyi CCMP1516]|uniref:Uncharacterized protein n=2 Tax=Emiliania huxleyi TaxID=2903 RepID=A0A0D3KFG1_EMIH1|nr:hypothetical protein EMIHUDRAFT_111324 [Emiliania huxleyi CCMP1516]EOD34496.1 hypothetical protein EMIHUDRAFT_111324 [Emiliania huxleyi CCMP1516]|eukprot:XP_005786925.1 hypothetical protein EMIHUDRAFT_111324 [Emiliania huxleyi CCMP1516]
MEAVASHAPDNSENDPHEKCASAAHFSSQAVAAALASVATQEEPSAVALAVACPVGGLTLSHVAYLLNLATKMAKATDGLYHNKALIFARWVAACAAASASGPVSLPMSASPADYNKRRELVCSRLRSASQRGGNTQAEAERAMRALEIESATRFVFPKITSTAADAGGGGGGGGAAAAAEIPAYLKLLAFAMGTHERLGASSAVRLLDMDALGLIAAAVLWEGWPPEIATWEEEDQVPCGEVDFVADYEAALEAEEEDDDEEGEEGEGEDAMEA